MQAAAALRNLAVNAADKVMLMKEGVVQPLISVLCDGTAAGEEQAVAMLGCLAGNDESKVALAKEGVVHLKLFNRRRSLKHQHDVCRCGLRFDGRNTIGHTRIRLKPIIASA